MDTNGQLKYDIWDPTGNITALVESPAVPADRPAVASVLMQKHPEVEQVGFVRFPEDAGSPVDAELCMAGGEFCGNASICAAALFLLKKGGGSDGTPVPVRLKVSGAEQAVEVSIGRNADGSFGACVTYPPLLGIAARQLSFDGRSETLQAVCLQGISHIIIRPDSCFWDLREDPAKAEAALRDWCALLGADCLGLMFLEAEGAAYRLIPFVFVPGSGTFFRENSCASGSAAAAVLLASECGHPVTLELREPGGCLRAGCDPSSGRIFLFGQARLAGSFTMDFPS